MSISARLAFEMYTILIFHFASVGVLVAFSGLIYFKAHKGPLLYSYLAFVTMLLIWMIAKIFKTVSPTIELRWFFIVLQYFGVQFMGFFFILFAYRYQTNRWPTRMTTALLLIAPTIGFIVVLTNPIHMQFYSYFDFYKDRFGPMFLPTQVFQYIYIFIGIVLLAKDYSKQPYFKNNLLLSRFFAIISLLPLALNAYYIAFKIIDIPWYFNFPVFDITPIGSTTALILFLIPAINYRFLDIVPLSFNAIVNNFPKGLAFVAKNQVLYASNPVFSQMLPQLTLGVNFAAFRASMTSDTVKTSENKHIKLKTILHKRRNIVIATDVTQLTQLSENLEEQNKVLVEKSKALENMNIKKQNLVRIKTRLGLAQNIHDILGHSLTVAIGTSELINRSSDITNQHLMIKHIKEILISSVSDLKNCMDGQSFDVFYTSLTQAIYKLSNPKIQTQIDIQGLAYEVDAPKTEAIYRLCQESITNAIRHGQAKTIHLFIRLKPNEIEIYTIDDGIGCKNILPNFGLKGIKSRIDQCGGTFSYGSDGDKGFHMHVVVPR